MNEYCCGALIVSITIFLIVILVPLSFSYVDYYSYGLVQRKSTGAVDTSQVFTRGRYALGPDRRFIKYPADAQLERLVELAVFTAGATNESVGLTVEFDLDFTYLLRKEEVGQLHEELASSFRDVVVSRTKDAIKNEAIFVTFNEYFQSRLDVESRFREAVQKRWDSNPSVHCMLDQFHIGRIDISDRVAKKQLESRVQNEKNDMERFLQQAQVEREVTAVEVNEINLQKDNLLRISTARADLVRATAKARGSQIEADAQTNGTKMLFEASGIVDQELMTAIMYIRTLKSRKNVDIGVSYLSPDNILRTTAV